jgi:hypothetical protein
MRRLRASAEDLIQSGSLHVELHELLASGLAVVDGCIYFAQELARNPHLSRERMGALGHQSLVNKLHLEDWWDSASSMRWDIWCVGQGVLLARAVIAAADTLTPLPVDVVLTLDPGGAEPPHDSYSTVSFSPDSTDLVSVPSSTFRFYVHRDGDCWIEDGRLEEKLDGVMILRRRHPSTDPRHRLPNGTKASSEPPPVPG